MTAFDGSWLVQRLERPFKRMGPLTDNPFSFGGGYKNGGLTDEAMGLLRGIFGFDYMGSAEFEFGAVPKALQQIAKAELTAFTFDIDGHTIYSLAPAAWKTDVEARIREFAEKDYGPGAYRLKEITRLHAVLNDEPYTDRLAGWLELDNGFMFFTDEEMWSKTCKLFGVETIAEAQEAA